MALVYLEGMRRERARRASRAPERRLAAGSAPPSPGAPAGGRSVPPGRSLAGGDVPLRDPALPARGRARAARRAGRQRRARPGARAPRASPSRRGARAFLAADEEHPPSAFAGIGAGGGADPRARRARGARITVHGDYDVDGVCSTAMLVRALRELGADVDSYLPDRAGDGYGLSLETVERLAARGTRLLITADCAITAVEEVAARARAGDRAWSSPTTTRRAPTGVLPRRADRAPGAVRLPVPGPVRDGGRLQARAGARAAPRGARAPRAAARATSTWWRWRRSPTWCRCWARTARSCAAACARSRATRQAGPARADGGRAASTRASVGRARGRLRAGAAAERRRAPVPRRRGPRADPDRGPRARGADRAGARRGQPRAPRRSSARSASRPKRRWPSWASATPTCSPARAGTRA